MDDNPIIYKPFKLFCPDTLTHLDLTAENFFGRQRIDMQALASCTNLQSLHLNTHWKAFLNLHVISKLSTLKHFSFAPDDYI